MNTTLIHADGRVLAAIDPSTYAASVADHAAWAASRLGSGLSFVHAIERSPAPASTNLSGNLTLGEHDALLDELTQLDEHRGRLAQTRGRQLLDQARERVRLRHDLNADGWLRHGALVDTLLDLEPEVRLFVIGKRGEHADFAAGHLGSNLERVIRSVHRPVLVAARAFEAPARVLIAYDGSPTSRKCIEMVCASPLLKSLDCDLVLAGEASARNDEHVAWATQRLNAAGFSPTTRIIAGSADTVIVEHAHANDVGLIVMGAYGHSRIRHLIVGSTTTHVMRNCQIPLLLLR